MTRGVEIRAIEQEDLARLEYAQTHGLFQLREGDEKECLAVNMTPYEAVASSVANSITSYMIFVDGVLVATWGYSQRSPLSGVGYPWLLTTVAMDKHKVFLAKNSRKAVEFLLQRFTRLEVFVAAEYLRAQVWLEWLGFSTTGPAIKINEVEFIHMWIERK